MATETKQTSSTNTGIINGLDVMIADTYALMAQTHLAHWNVEGPDFFQLHVAFEEQYTELFTAVDTIAEHLRTKEVYAPGGLEMLAGLSGVGAMKRHETAKDFVASLIVDHEALVANTAATRDLAGESGDSETEDLCIERIQVHDKTIWMLKSWLK
ncbi:MAG: Dps family protein [Luteolibacter sp.]